MSNPLIRCLLSSTKRMPEPCMDLVPPLGKYSTAYIGMAYQVLMWVHPKFIVQMQNFQCLVFTYLGTPEIHLCTH